MSMMATLTFLTTSLSISVYLMELHLIYDTGWVYSYMSLKVKKGHVLDWENIQKTGNNSVLF